MAIWSTQTSESLPDFRRHYCRLSDGLTMLSQSLFRLARGPISIRRSEDSTTISKVPTGSQKVSDGLIKVPTRLPEVGLPSSQRTFSWAALRDYGALREPDQAPKGPYHLPGSQMVLLGCHSAFSVYGLAELRRTYKELKGLYHDIKSPHHALGRLYFVQLKIWPFYALGVTHKTLNRAQNLKTTHFR
jgi:hypothetical protein